MTLDIDCLADETEIFDFDLLGALSPELEHHTEGPSSADQTVVKVNVNKRRSTSTERESNTKKTRRFKKGLSVKEALKAYDQKPNMSRRRPTNVLVAFPVFDKCDSLLYFPTSLIRHFNSADIKCASKLMHKYVDKSCVFTFNCSSFPEINHVNYLGMMDIAGDLEPDRIMCVHSTKVVENQIKATIYMKITDLQPLYNTVDALKGANVAKMGLYRERAKRFQTFADDAASHSEELQQQLISYSYAEEGVLLYIRLDLALTLDCRRGKIVKVDHVFQLTSVQEAV